MWQQQGKMQRYEKTYTKIKKSTQGATRIQEISTKILYTLSITFLYFLILSVPSHRENETYRQMSLLILMYCGD